MSLASVFKPIFKEEPDRHIEFDLVQNMNKMLSITDQYDPPRPEQKYRVSHVIKLCPREEVLRYLYQIKRVDKVEATLRRTFDIGKAFHTLVQNDWFGKWGWLVGDWECTSCHKMFENSVNPKVCDKCFQTNFFYHELTPASEEHGITAHLDGVLFVGGKKKVLELKTTNAMQFGLVANTNRRPQDAHKRQVNMYMFLTGIKEAVILYFNKNESTVHQFEEKYDESLVQEMLSNLRQARDGMRTGVVPERKVCESKTCSRAKQCPVRDLCFKQ
jgi:hypothetical protein